MAVVGVVRAVWVVLLMTIAKSAIDAFLARDLAEFDFLKGEQPAELDQALAELDPPPDFHTDPFIHQKIMFLIGVYLPEFLFFSSMGTGKTKVVLDLFWWYRRAYGFKKMLVMVPNVSNVFSWEEEVPKHRPELTGMAMDRSLGDRWEMLEQPADVCVLNYQGLVSMGSRQNPNKGKKSRAWALDTAAVDEIASHFDFVVFDESQAFKNTQSLTYSICRRLAGQLDARFALTGTPMGRDALDLWGQFYVVDRGKTLGPNKAIFRESFFKARQTPWTVEYKLRKDREQLLNKVLKNRSIRFSAEECLDLPKQVFKRVPVEFPNSMVTYYNTIRQKMKEAQMDKQTLEFNFAKMRQLSSGFLYQTDEDTGERMDITFDQNPKMDALLELLSDMPQDAKCVVFHEFVRTGELIEQALQKKKYGVVRLWSGTDNHREVLKKFNNNKNTCVLAVNNASGAQGLNLQVANYVVFFESPVDPITRQQAEKRCHRPGQDKPVFYFDLIMKDSVDERIMSFLKEGKNLMRAIIDGSERI